MHINAIDSYIVALTRLDLDRDAIQEKEKNNITQANGSHPEIEGSTGRFMKSFPRPRLNG